MASTRIVPDEPIIDVIGASQYHLRVITLAGEVVFEKAISELRSLGLEDIVDNVSRSMGVLPHRLSLLHGAKKLRFGKSLHEVLPIFDDDVDLTVVLGPADPTRTFLLEAGCILGIRRSGPMQLTVTFQPGKLREDRGAAGHDSKLEVYHSVILIPPDGLLGSSGESTEVSRSKGNSLEDEVVLELQNPGLSFSTGFQELGMYYSRFRLDSWVLQDGIFRSKVMSQDYLSASAELSGLVRLCGVMMGYWLLEAVSLFSALCLAIVAGSLGHTWQCLALLLTIWLPGFVWSFRYHSFLLERKTGGPLGAQLWLCLFAFVCLCGIIWFWLPLAALLASLVLPLLFSGKLLFLLLRVAGCHEYEAPYPWNIKQFVELEVYMRHLPACGNAPRAMLFVIMHVWDSPPSDEGRFWMEILMLTSSCLGCLLSFLPYRIALTKKAWTYFDEVIMELESD